MDAKPTTMRRLEMRPIGPARNIDSDGFECALISNIVLCQPLADFGRSRADDRIVSRVIIWRASKYIRSDHAFPKHLVAMRH